MSVPPRTRCILKIWALGEGVGEDDCFDVVFGDEHLDLL